MLFGIRNISPHVISTIPKSSFYLATIKVKVLKVITPPNNFSHEIGFAPPVKTGAGVFNFYKKVFDLWG